MTRRVALTTLYAVVTACVESSVVIYFRLLVDGGTTLFPVKPVPPGLLHLELLREVATMVMLAAVARLQSRQFRFNLAYFLYCFGVWDLSYYFWFRLLTGWPPGLLSWDILFLVPRPWFGPVLAPSLVSLLFIAGSLVILRFEAIGMPMRFAPLDWISGFAGAALILASFLWVRPDSVRTGYPLFFPWWLFAAGAALWVGMFTRRALLTARNRR